MSITSFDADLYRLLHRGSPGDVAYYRRICTGAAQVLELGCGDGRVSLPLAESGVTVTGIDAHPGMLSAAESDRARVPIAVRQRLQYVRADISNFSLDTRFDRIIAPYTTLYALSPDERAQCLRHVAEHLTPDGRFVFDVYSAGWMLEEGSYSDPSPILMARITHDGHMIDVYEQDVHDATRQHVSVHYIYEFEEGGVTKVSTYTIEHHYLLLEQIEPTLNAAGLALESIEGDFEGNAFTDTSARLVVKARRLT